MPRRGEDLHTQGRRRHHRPALRGSRAPKNAPSIEVNGEVDEAQAVMGLARAEAEAGLASSTRSFMELERDLWVLMAEVATAPANRHKLTAGASLVTPEMVPGPGGPHRRAERPLRDADASSWSPVRTGCRPSWTWPAPWCAGPSGACRPPPCSPRLRCKSLQVGPYLNRLSDLLWTMARWQEGEHLESRSLGTRPGGVVSPASEASARRWRWTLRPRRRA